MIERIGIGAPFRLQQNRYPADDKENGKARAEDKTLRQDRLPAGSRVNSPPSSRFSFLVSFLVRFLGDELSPRAYSGSH
jgi:hypothetical protein